MAKKRKNTPAPKSADNSFNPYELKTDAVDRLVNADKKTYPPLTLKNDPTRVYKKGFLDRIPSVVKSLFIKFWFNGAVCFFIFWGLGIVVPNMQNMILILAFALGVVNDLLVNNVFRFFAPSDGANDKWMMFPKKRYVNLFLNILYSFGILLLVIWIYNVINIAANAIFSTERVVYVGVEPILFGILYMAMDMLLVAIKNIFAGILADAKRKNGV